MTSRISNASSKSEKIVARPLSLFLLGGLLFLRLPFLVGMRLIDGNPSSDWVEQVFFIGTYFLIAVLIWVERDHLDDFHISPLALALILLFKPLMPWLEYLMGLTASFTNLPKPLSYIYLLISISLLVALKLSGWRWKRVSSSEWKWLGIGTITGIGLLILLALPMAFNIKSIGGAFFISIQDLIISLFRIPQQLGYAAITEEPVFRGFLWGLLRIYGWKNGTILIFQAALFMLGHAYYFNSVPISFWVVVPSAGLVFGLLVWRSRTIVSSLACHAISNAFGAFVGQIVGHFIF